MLAGLDVPDFGTISVNKQDLSKLSQDKLSQFRAKNLGVIFQQYHLMSNLTALENVGIPLELQKVNDFQSPIRIESYNYPKNLVNDFSYILAVSKLLPSYSYPVGLHVVDRFVKIPQWMKKASKNYWSTHALKSVMNNQNKGPNSLVLKYISNKNRTWANRPKNKGGRIEK